MSEQELSTFIPIRIELDRPKRVLVLVYEEGTRFELSFEYLRVYSPSAQVQGHGKGQEVLQTGKKDVAIVAVEPVGNYAIRPVFSDGHVSGIYSWSLLYSLGNNAEALWQEYLQRLDAAGASRDHVAQSGSDKPSSPCSRHI